MTKQIPVAKIIGFSGKPLRVPKRDEDGNIVWKNEELKTEPEIAEADTLEVLRIISLNISREIQTSNDPLRVSQLWHRLDTTKDGIVELHDKLYDWLHRLLNREIPLTAVEKERGIKPIPYSQQLFSMNSAGVVRQLKDVDERKKLNGEMEAEE